MPETDFNAALLAALNKRWGPPNSGIVAQAWDVSKVQLRLLSIEYPELMKRIAHTPVTLREEEINNRSAATLEHSFEYSVTTTDAYEWHVTAGVRVTAGAKATVTLPLVGEGEASAEVELKVEGGSKTTHSEEVTWTASEKIEVPPHTNVRAKAVLSTGKVSKLPFTAHMYAYGSVGVKVQWGSDPSYSVWMWGDLDTGGWYVPASWSKIKKLPLDPSDREFVIEGDFNGSVGFHVAIDAEPITVSDVLTEPVRVGAPS